MLETQLYLVNGVVALLAAAIPIYLTIRLNNDLRQLTAILSIFILVHAIHSWLDFFGFDFLSDGVFEPLSAAVLMLFGIFYYWIAKQKKISIKRMVIIWSPVPVLFIFLGTIVLLLAALSIFVWLATRSKDIRSFQFQFSIYNNLDCGRDSLYSSGFRNHCGIAAPSRYWIRNKLCFLGLFEHYDMA